MEISYFPCANNSFFSCNQSCYKKLLTTTSTKNIEKFPSHSKIKKYMQVVNKKHILSNLSQNTLRVE